MGKQRKEPRIPPTFEGLQINFCKSPICGNFGVPASELKQPRGPGSTKSPDRDSYKRDSRGDGIVQLNCLKCGEKFAVKNNRAIHEELTRFLDHITPAKPQTTCPTPGCPNGTVEISSRKAAYSKYGKTAAGSPRLSCKLCGKVFTVSTPKKERSPIDRQKVHGYKNLAIFRLLMNKMPLRRICEVEELGFKSLVDHIRFIHRQCVAFAASRDSRLPQMALGDRFISVDRQDYNINWLRTGDKRNVVLHGLGSADLETGFVFGMHLNYDMSLNIEDVEAEAWRVGDYDTPPHFRRFSRLWLPREYLTEEEEVELRESQSVMTSVENTYREAYKRSDVDVFDRARASRRLPEKGMQIHGEYTLHGHFHFLKHLLQGAQKITFYLDQESGIRSACHSAFSESILDKRCDAFYVRINKDLTIHEKQALKRESDALLEAYIEANPHLLNLRLDEIRHLFLKEVLRESQLIGPWKDRWIMYPFPNMSEPEKAVCWLTDIEDRSYPGDEIASLFMDATLHPIDRFFMQARRRVSLLERSIFSSSSNRRVWHAYAPYKPEMAVWLLDIFRVFYNYVKVGDDKKTAAMRLGLARGPVPLKDITYFVPSLK